MFAVGVPTLRIDAIDAAELQPTPFERLGERLGKLQSRANLTYQIVDRAMVIEGTLRNKLAPGLSAALNFSRGLSAQGVR